MIIRQASSGHRPLRLNEGRGTRYHALPWGCTVALCGTTPELQDPDGWYPSKGPEVTCKRCLDILAKDSNT